MTVFPLCGDCKYYDPDKELCCCKDEHVARTTPICDEFECDDESEERQQAARKEIQA